MITTDERLERLEALVSELRAETGTEALEVRARIRELERRVEELSSSAPNRATSAQTMRASEPKPEPRKQAGKEPRTKPPTAAAKERRADQKRNQANKTGAKTLRPS